MCGCTMQKFPLLLKKEKLSNTKCLVIFSFDMKFTYVLPGWKGTISDSRILKHALSKKGDKLEFLKVSQNIRLIVHRKNVQTMSSCSNYALWHIFIYIYFLGKYYLGDAWFPLKSGLCAPYKCVHYHLKEYLACGPQNAKEIFNHWHISLINVIEKSIWSSKREISNHS